MAFTKLSVILVISAAFLTKPSYTQNVKDNTIDQDDISPLAEAAAEILKNQNLQNIGGLVNTFLQSGGAEQLGNVLSSATKGKNADQILQGLGSVLGQAQNLDPNILGAVANMFAAQTQNSQKKGGKSQDSPGFDPSLLLQLLGSFMGESGNGQNLMEYLPMIIQTVNSFMGPEADERSREHSDHASLLPPFLEKMHVFFDHFMHSDLGKRVIATLGAEKFVKIFVDESGKLNYDKFVEMMENQSFRRHWIRMVTDRIALLISYVSDPKVQKKYLASVQNLVNGLLKSQGYPKSTLFDPTRPIETITAFANYFAKHTLNVKINAKEYVKPAVEYVQKLFAMAQQKGVLMGQGVDSRQLSDTLADTINLEVIEPVARVNRAMRFAKKVPECAKYVMCLVNQPTLERESLPGLTFMLSRGLSLVSSWFLSSSTGTSFWSLYNIIMEENNCRNHYLEICNEFHLEEIKVTTEYVHSEL